MMFSFLKIVFAINGTGFWYARQDSNLRPDLKSPPSR